MCIFTKTLRAVAVCTALGVLGCGSLTRTSRMTEPNADAATVLNDVGPSFSRALLAASSSGWAADRVEILVGLYSQDAILFPPKGDPIEGQAAIRRYWSRTPDRRILAHSIVVDSSEMSGNLLIEHGRFTQTRQISDKPPETVTVTYISAWRRDLDGVWRKRLDSWW